MKGKTVFIKYLSIGDYKIVIHNCHASTYYIEAYS